MLLLLLPSIENPGGIMRSKRHVVFDRAAVLPQRMRAAVVGVLEAAMLDTKGTAHACLLQQGVNSCGG